jgi:hypothetical protein
MKPTTKPVLAALALCITLLPALAQAACPSDLEAAAVASPSSRASRCRNRPAR